MLDIQYRSELTAIYGEIEIKIRRPMNNGLWIWRATDRFTGKRLAQSKAIHDLATAQTEVANWLSERFAEKA